MANGDTTYIGARWQEVVKGDYSFYASRQINNEDNEKLITGGFNGIIAIDNQDSLVNDNNRSGFIGLKDSCGNWKWSKKIEGAGYNQVNTSLAHPDGWLIAGVFSDTINPGGNELTSEAYQSIFLCKLDDNGEYIWAKKLDIPPVGGKQFLANANDDKFYLATEFTGELALEDTIFSSPDNRSVLIFSLEEDGEIDNIKMIKSGSSLNLDVVEPVQGNRLLIGVSYSDTTMVGNYELVNSGSEDFFIAQLSEHLQVQWIKTTEGIGSKKLTGAVRHQNGYVFYGEYRNEFGWEGEYFPNSKGKHLFMLKLLNNGNLQWKQSITGPAHKNMGSVVSGNNHQLYLWAN